MKKQIISAIILAFTALTPFISKAQKPMTEGKVVYEISFPDMELDEQTKAMMPTESTVYFKGNMSRTELGLGMGMSSSSIFNGKTGDITSLTDIMGNKTYMTTNAEKMNAKQGEGSPKIEASSESKDIAGYSCKKNLITMKDGATLEIYTTDKISSQMGMVPGGKDLKGFPMEYSLDQGGMKMKFVAKSVTAEKVGDDMFKVPDGYKLVTPEELQKMYGGGQ